MTLVLAETGNVEQPAVDPGENIDSVAAVLEGVLEEHGEDDTKDRRRKDAALFHSAAAMEGLRCCTIEADCAVYVLMERGGQPQEGVGGSQFSAVA